MLTIPTRRFILREYSPADRDAFIAYQTDPAFTLFHQNDELGDDNARAVFQLFLNWSLQRPRLNYQLAITPRLDSAALIGSCGVRMDGCAKGEAIFGVELARAYWGRYRFADEASSAMIAWAFEQLELDALIADTAKDNSAVERLAEAAGFVQARAEAKQWWRLERTVWEQRFQT
jgi:[ribosomal protein S5]-alanine N-acetyltransferase